MSTPLRLPVHSWGPSDASRRALLVHGLGSNGPLMWRFGTALADAGWRADAVDLRGHGTAPRALDYTIDAFAADVAAHRDAAGPWDLVVGHSLGGAAATVAAAADPTWTRRLVLVDPAIRLDEDQREGVRQSQEESFADPSVETVRATHPTWHPNDIELKALSIRQASRWAIEQSSAQNEVWDVTAAALALTVPTLVIGADPAVYSLFTGAVADEVLTNPSVTLRVVAGAGHSPHRDDPEQTLGVLGSVLA